MDIRDKRVLINGGSSGIGLALARSLGIKGDRIVVSGRRIDMLNAAIKELRAARIDALLVADVAIDTGRTATLAGEIDALGGLDVLLDNAGGAWAGRLGDTTEVEIRAMMEVDLIAPIPLTQAALPHLRANGDGLVVNIAFGIALIDMPFYSAYAAVKAGLARFGEALRRELTNKGVHVMTVYPAATDTSIMRTSRAGPERGFTRKAADTVTSAIVDGIIASTFKVIRGGEARVKMSDQTRDDPAALNRRFATLQSVLAAAVCDRAAL